MSVADEMRELVTPPWVKDYVLNEIKNAAKVGNSYTLYDSELKVMWQDRDQSFPLNSLNVIAGWLSSPENDFQTYHESMSVLIIRW